MKKSATVVVVQGNQRKRKNLILTRPTQKTAPEKTLKSQLKTG